jgi:phage gp29-like protein
MTLYDQFAAAIGRPRAIEGESMVVSDGLMATHVTPDRGGVYFLPVDEIIRRKGWKEYKQMLHDEQIKQCLDFKKILVVGRTWQLKPKDDTPLAKEVANFCTECLNDIDLTQVFWEAASAFEFGYSLGEIVWTRKPIDTKDFPGIVGGQAVVLEKIAHRDPQELYLEMDVHGNFLGARQLSHGENISLSPEKLMLFSHNKRFGNLYGDSDLRAAYRSWWAKSFIINFWNVYLERMGSPMTLMKYPQGSSGDLKEVLKQILGTLATSAQVLVPDGVQVELIEAKRAGNADYAASLEYHNRSIAKAMLMSSLFGTGGESNSTRGSDSQSFLQLRILFKMADRLSRQLSEALMCQVVKQLVELNYGVDAPMPKFIWQDYGQYEGMKIADEIRQLHMAGLIDPDQADVNYVRSVIGLPIRDEDDPEDDVIRPAATPLSGAGATAPPAAPQGNTRADKGGSAEGDSTGSKGSSNPNKK